LVFSIHDSTELAIQKMIEASQRMITISSSSNEGVEGGWGGMNSAMRIHLELQIKSLRNAPREMKKTWSGF
jgi:hypothetical protein